MIYILFQFDFNFERFPDRFELLKDFFLKNFSLSLNIILTKTNVFKMAFLGNTCHWTGFKLRAVQAVAAIATVRASAATMILVHSLI